MTDSSAANSTPESVLEDFVDPIGRITRSIWWLVLLRGIFAVLFGIIAILAPLAALLGIVFVFAAYALIDGVIAIVHAIRVRDRDRRWGWLLAQGIVSVVAGIVAFIFPATAGLIGGTFVLAIIAFYAVVVGIAGIPAAASITDGGRKVLGIIVSILSIVLGVGLAIYLLAVPGLAVLNGIWVVGIYAIIIGVMLIVAAIQARASAPKSAPVAATA